MAELGRLSSDRDPVVAKLLSQGMTELRRGDRDRAHELLRQAAALAPYDETVWWALLEVVDHEDDRVVCLENILAINPNNPEARRLLRLAHLNEDISELTPPIPAKNLSSPPTTVRSLPRRAPAPQASAAPRRWPLKRLLRLLGLMLFFGLLAAALAVVISILLYGV